MSDAVTFESPVVRDYSVATSADALGDLVLADASATVKWLVRADPDGAAAGHLNAAFGSSRTVPNGVLILGSRPGEWIVLGDLGAVGEVIDDLNGITGSEHVTTLDWTHARALFRLSGTDATRALEKVCSRDWCDDMTPPGAVASASVAKVTCDLARRDTDSTRSYLILCDRSFGQYLFDAIIDAGQEFGLSVGPADAVGLVGG